VKKDYLFWLYPIVYVGLLVIVICWDRNTGKPAGGDVNTDTSLTLPAKNSTVEDLKIIKSADSASMPTDTIIERLNFTTNLDSRYPDDNIDIQPAGR